MSALHDLRAHLSWLELGAGAPDVDVATDSPLQETVDGMTLTLLALASFLLGALVARLTWFWFLARLGGIVLWLAGLVFVLKTENAQLRSAVEAEQARESEALRRAQLDLVSRMGSR